MPRAMPTLSKLAKPSAVGLLSRERLFADLDAAYPGHLIWVSGPAGAGKTSLVSSWIENRKLSYLWYQVDLGDADPGSLVQYLTLAAQKLNKRKRPELPQLTPERLPGFEIFVRRYFEMFFARLSERITLVFDNFQELGADSLSIAVISGALALLPAGARLVCISREQAPPALARWRAEPGFREVAWDALRLTDEEARAFEPTFNGHSSIEQLNHVARGWAAGLRLLLRARHAGVVVETADEMSSSPLFDYFAAEILNRTDPALRDFLLRSAVLPRVAPGIAAALTSDAQAPQRLAWLHRNRLFTEAHTRHDQTIVYEYHPLFRQFLTQQAAHSLGADRCASLARKGAQLLTQGGEIDDAATLWIATQDWVKLTELICEHAPGFAAAGRFVTLASWMEHIPERLRHITAWLSYWEGVCLGMRAPAAARPHLVRAAANFKAHGDVAGECVAIAAIIVGYAMEWGRLDSMDPWIIELDRLWSVVGDRLPPVVQTQVINCAQAILFRAPEHPLLKTLAQRARTLIRELPELRQRVQIAEFLLHYLEWSGEFTEAEAICGEITAQDRGDSSWFWASFRVWQAIVSWQAADHEAAYAALNDGLAAARQHGLAYLEPLLYSQIAQTALSAGDLDRAQQAIQAGLKAPHAERGINAAHFEVLQMGWFLRKGQTEAATEWARRAVNTVEEVGTPFFEAVSSRLYAEALIVGGRHHEAREYLHRALDFARRMPSKSSLFHALIPLAWSHFQTGESDLAAGCLREAMKIGAQQNYMNCHPFWNPTIMSDLCARALGAQIETDYVRRLIRKRGLVPPSTDIEHWPWRIRLYAMGQFSVVVDEAILTFGAKAPKRPLDLIKALIANGGRSVNLDHLAGQLWPELDGDAGRNALEIALHRLRKLMCYDDAITIQDGKLGLDRRQVWVDVWAFEQLANSIEQLDSCAGQPDQVPETAKHLLRLYSGHFLAHEETAWSIAARQSLQSKLLRMVTKLGRLLEAEHQWEPAMDLYRRSIELDPLAEESHRHLMRCYHAQGRIAEAIGTYRRCRDVLFRSLGVEPSPATQAAYQALKPG